MNRKIYVKEKLLIDILKAVLIVMFSVGIYYVWVTFYNPYIPKKLYRGSFLICLLFGVVYFFLAQTYGAFMIGTSTVSDLIYSHGICIALTLSLTYVIFSLMSYAFVNVIPFIIMFAVYFAFAVIWVFITDRAYFAIHPPRKTIVVYDRVDSYLSLRGIKSMDRRFKVVETLRSRNTELDTVFEKLLDADAVFLCGVPAEYRNEIVKFCVRNNKVAYIKPKISDTIIRGGKTIQLLNVPVYRCTRSNPKL